MAAFKWTGAILVLFSAGGLGIWSAMQWKGRLRMLETLRQMIYFLKGEITYSRAPLAEALERVGKREPGPLGGLFEAAAEGIYMQEGESLQEIWRRQVMDLNTDGAGFPWYRRIWNSWPIWGNIWDIWMWTCRSGPLSCIWNSWI